jgi:hypothetical protein
MYDPKFEKAIQRKMEELEFRPTESVWVNIEKAVAVKRRRRTAFIWRFLLPGAFLVAAAGLYLHYSNGKPAHNLMTSTATTSTATTNTAATNSNARGGDAIAADATGNNTTAEHSGVGNRPAGMVATGGGFTGRSAKGGMGDAAAKNGVARGKDGVGRDNDDVARGNDGTAGDPAIGNDGTATGSTGQTSLIGQTGETGPTTQRGQTGETGQKAIAPWFYAPGLVDLRLTRQVQGTALNTKKSNGIAISTLAHPASGWEAGFVAGGGWSRLNRLNVNGAKSAVSSSASSLYSFTSRNSSSKQNYISDVRPDASFDGGIYLQKTLSSHWVFNTGMNLHYYSNFVSVGQQLTTYVQASSSFVIPTTLAPAQNTSMYSAGDTRTYTNRYYFVELPVGLQWKVNKSHLLPVFVEGGVSLTRLMGSNALFYDAKTGLYSRDGDVVNKTQFNVSSALLVGLPIHGIGLELGPQIQYGLTPLVNTQGVGDQHFLYMGFRLIIIPGRK